MQKNTLNLLHGHGFMFSQHRCRVNENNYEQFNDKLTTLQLSWEMDNGMYSVCDLNHKRFLYLCPKLHKLIGNHTPVNWAPGSKDGFYGYIHSNDLAFVLDTERMVYEFLNPLPLYEKQKYKLIYEFRLIGEANVSYRLVNHLKLLEHDKFGNSWLLLIKSNLVYGNFRDETMHRFLLNSDTKKLCLFCDNGGSKPHHILTRRELEILSLISQGLDNNTIAEKLFISIGTLCKHKQNIIEKTQTANITQALIYAGILGLV